MYRAEKNVTFFQNCRSGTGGFCWKLVWSLTFCSFLDKKQLKKDYVLGAKNVTFFQKCRSGTGGFCWKLVWNLTFCSFLDKKQLKKFYVLGGKKNVTFFQSYRFGIGWYQIRPSGGYQIKLVPPKLKKGRKIDQIVFFLKKLKKGRKIVRIGTLQSTTELVFYSFT